MNILRNPLLAAAFALPLCASVAQADKITLTAGQMVLAARQALAAGQPQVALPLTRAYLKAHPDAVVMLVLQSRAERDLGQSKAARATAKRAWALAENDTQKFTVAMVAAQAASSDGNKMAGQIWLRRASNHASTPAQKLQLRRDFNYVRARNPWRLQLDFGLTPSSNVNDGSSEDQFQIDGLPFVFALSPDAQALSGVEGFAALNLSYRLSEGGGTRNWLGLQAYHNEVWLSDSSKEDAPDVSGSDYRYSSVTLTYRHQRLLGANRGMLDLNLRLGRNWYGGDPLSVLFGAGAQFHFPARNRKQLSLRMQYDLQAPEDAEDADTHTARLGLQYRLPWHKNRLTLSTDLRKSFSDDKEREYDEIRAGLDIDFAKQIAGASFAAGMAFAYRDYDVAALSADGRRDKTFTGYGDMTLHKISYWGFAPVVSIKHTTTQSNIARYTKSETSLGLSIRSQF